MGELPCSWAPITDPLYRAYHDQEWGVPERDPRALWEKLQLDGFQAGLSWITILRKREHLRRELDHFSPERLVHWSDARVERALQNPNIIRSRQKVRATITNARAMLEMREQGIDFSEYLWGFVEGRPIVNHLERWKDAPAQTPLSVKLSKDLKQRGFKFCGPVIVYAFMQAVGMVNDHETRCERFKAVQTQRGPRFVP